MRIRFSLAACVMSTLATALGTTALAMPPATASAPPAPAALPDEEVADSGMPDAVPLVDAHLRDPAGREVVP